MITFAPQEDARVDGRIAIAAAVDGEQVGLARAGIQPASAVATLQAVIVSDSHRGQGVGQGLIHALERHARERGLARIETTFDATSASAPTLSHILDKLNWQGALAPAHVLCASHAAIADAPWIGLSCPADYEVFDWSDLTADADAELAATQAAAPWFPPALGPLPVTETDADTSIGVRWRGRVVGWMLTHRAAPDLVRYSRLFVAQEHRTRLCGVALVAAAIRRQMAARIERGTFTVLGDNQPMMRIVRRRLAPYLETQRAIIHACRDLMR